ncbi:MAG: molybdenum cofactor guanylyltransferase [Woeseiaceae bacterium]|nr:molybdenum cofactor guanylyltransferase [Woeseiaceae bacterium]
MKNNKYLWGLILTGGQSKRMGHDKALLESQGKSQLSKTFSLLEQSLTQVFVSVREDQEKDNVRSQYPMITDAFENLGPLAGILSAMKKYPRVSWMVVACDLLNLDKETLSCLIKNFPSSSPFVAYKSEYNDLPEPLCAIYSNESVAIIEKNLADNVKCPRKILINSDTLLLTQPNKSALENFNTPDDLINSKYRNK